MTTDKKGQLPLFQAEASWFHVFRSMVASGDIAKLGPYSTTVYLVIKSYANHSTGTAFPSVDLIVEKSGISRAQVTKSLSALVDAGYLTRTLKGRKNYYTLRERVEIQGLDGAPEAVASWDFIPKHVKAAREEIKNFVMTGKAGDAQIIHIERLTLNIQTGDNAILQTGDNAIMLALNSLDGVDNDLRERFARLMAADRAHKQAQQEGK